jgi:hypothetical protein
MSFVEILFAFVVALVLTMLLIPLTAPRRARNGESVVGTILFFFLILFLASWAGGLWLTPVGPPLWGGFWAPFLLVGIFVTLMLAAAGEPSRHYDSRSRVTEPSTAEEATETAAVVAFGMMFWVLILGLVAAVIAGYMSR